MFFAAGAKNLGPIGAVRVGALPDMVALGERGLVAVVANEGEPSDGFSVDPEGSIPVVRLPSRVRVFGPTVNAQFPVSANLEPEYVTTVGATAYLTLQEANAIAVVDLQRAKVSRILPLGYKDYGVAGQGLDSSDRDRAINIRTVAGLRGLYMPDSIGSYTSRGDSYLVTANEGDAREWGDYVEAARVKDLGKNGVAPRCAGSPFAPLTGDADLGRLNVTTASGLRADGSCYARLYTFGTRSFSIWDTGVAIGEIRGRTYAFIGLERIGGVIVFDITRPSKAAFVTYLNNRDFAVSVADDGAQTLPAAGDLGPEGLTFIPAKSSPNREPMLAVANEVSGTTTLFGIDLADH